MVKCLPKFNISQSMVTPNCFRSHQKTLDALISFKKKKSDVQSEIHLVQSNISTRQSARALKKVSSGLATKKILLIKKIHHKDKEKYLWFNSPYGVSMETNIEKFFLKLIGKHFPKTFKFHKIFNKNNVKVSYSCLLYFANMIKLHNNRIFYEETAQGQHKCNCWQKDVGPLVGNCLGKELIHQCNLKENTASNEVNYNSLTENTFIKNWFYKHHNSLKYKSIKLY